MKDTKRKIALLLVMVLLFTTVPMQQIAEAATIQEIDSFSLQYVNPLYEEILTPEDLPDRETEDGIKTAHRYNSAGYTTTLAEAADVIRPQMVNHTESITVLYKSSTAANGDLIQEMIQDVFTHTGKGGEGDNLKFQYTGYNTQISGYKQSGIYYYTLNFTIGYMTTVAQEAELTQAVKLVLENLDLADKSDYEKTKAVYDYICENVSYDYTNLNDKSYLLKYSAYAAMMNHTAVCQGYANLMYRMLLDAGVDVRIIAGMGNGGKHAWNIAEIDDHYYNLDATWDSANTEYKYFLAGSIHFTDHVAEEQYLTDDFTRQYPISSLDYEKPQEEETPEQVHFILENDKSYKIENKSGISLENFVYYDDGTDEIWNEYEYFEDDVYQYLYASNELKLPAAGDYTLVNVCYSGEDAEHFAVDLSVPYKYQESVTVEEVSAFDTWELSLQPGEGIYMNASGENVRGMILGEMQSYSECYQKLDSMSELLHFDMKQHEVGLFATVKEGDVYLQADKSNTQELVLRFPAEEKDKLVYGALNKDITEAYQLNQEIYCTLKVTDPFGVTEVTGTDAPEATDTDAPEATDTDAPEATDTDAPEDTDTDASEATDTDASEATDTDAPETTDTDASEATNTDAPEATDTDAQEETGPSYSLQDFIVHIYDITKEKEITNFVVVGNKILFSDIIISPGDILRINVTTSPGQTVMFGEAVCIVEENGTNCHISLDYRGGTSIKIESDVYQIDEESKLLQGIDVGSTVEELLENLANNAQVSIYTTDREMVSTDVPLATGMKVVLERDGIVEDVVDVVVTGDCNGDGAISVLDMENIQKSILGIGTLDGCYFEAAKVNGNDTLSVLDMENVQKYILGLVPSVNERKNK